MNWQEIIDYARTRYGVEPEHLWARDPRSFILRRQSSKKWFALVMYVPAARLGLPGEAEVCILDLKCGPILSASLRGQPGYHPAYHMNKTNWLTVLLDGTVPRGEIETLLEISYDLAK